ncbi:hypothetical protein K1719_013271 [Acacia pycnantha]|nr:hypothetical protein K1719_013271 [Acacia pycnantha]
MADQAITADQAIMANQAASLPTTGQSASASVTNKASSLVIGKRKAMKQRSKVWDHFSKFVNEKDWPKRMQLISGRLHNTGPTLSEDGDIYLLLLAVANDFSFLDELFK